jgi:hypothetical protein
MTRISSLLVASTLAILPISAFAQQAAAPAKAAEPTAMSTTAPATAPVTGKTATTATTTKPEVKTTTNATAKPDAKTPSTDSKTDIHGMNTHSKTTAPVKTAEPPKS